MLLPKKLLIEKIEKLPEFEKRDLFLENGSKVKKFVGIGIVGTNKIVAVVSKRYTLIQFRDVFLPILNSFEENVFGRISYYNGKAYLTIFPDDEKYKINILDTTGNIGILVRNSVDRSVAISFDFIISTELGDVFFEVKDMKKLKRKHIGNVKSEIKSIVEFLDNIKELWKIIVEKLHKLEINEDRAKDILKECKIGKTARRRILNKLFSKRLNESKKEIKLWDLFAEIIKEIGKGNYKSEIHRIDKVKNVSKVLFGIVMVEEI